MKVFIDCFPCFVKQALECSRLSTTEDKKHKEVLNSVMNILSDMDYTKTPVHIARSVYGEIKNITSTEDPYYARKREDNKQMMELYTKIEDCIISDPLYLSCKLAAGGNLIDSGTGQRKEDHDFSDIEKYLYQVPAIDDFESLKLKLSNAKTLLYLGDNSGEIVLDKLFISNIKKQYPTLHIYFAVRGSAVLNDVLLEDALELGLDSLTEIISNGDSAPGTELEYCSDEFKKIFASVDLIISKGQGNYETLSLVENNNIYFLLLGKCPIIARDLKVDVGKIVIKKIK